MWPVRARQPFSSRPSPAHASHDVSPRATRPPQTPSLGTQVKSSPCRAPAPPSALVQEQAHGASSPSRHASPSDRQRCVAAAVPRRSLLGRAAQRPAVTRLLAARPARRPGRATAHRHLRRQHLRLLPRRRHGARGPDDPSVRCRGRRGLRRRGGRRTGPEAAPRGLRQHRRPGVHHRRRPYDVRPDPGAGPHRAGPLHRGRSSTPPWHRRPRRTASRAV